MLRPFTLVPLFLLASPTSYHPGLPLTVRVRFCGIIEGSVARAHGLHWGWLKALTLFAYQMPCGRENTDLHGRKPTDRPGDSVSLLRSQGPRGTFASHACVSVCVCVYACVCVRGNGGRDDGGPFFKSWPGDSHMRASMCRGVYEDAGFKMCL